MTGSLTEKQRSALGITSSGNNRTFEYGADTNWENQKKYLDNLIKTGTAGQKAWAEAQLKKLIEAKIYFTGAAFKNGGLVDFTGPAWVDGSKSAPEAFLDAQDTRNFAQLKDILASLLRADRFKANEVSPARGGDCTIYVTVDQIASDYDIDEAIARIKQEIMSGSAYRNINLVNRHR